VAPPPFIEFSFENPLQGCLFSNVGACLVNLPAPERYTVHKLIVHGEQPLAARVKAHKDLLQAASLIPYFVGDGQAEVFNAAWRDAIGRGKGWQRRADAGTAALLRIAPEPGVEAL
jgi:hypothetical protein